MIYILKVTVSLLLGVSFVLSIPVGCSSPPSTPVDESGGKLLFDGKSFKGWEGDTLSTWRIRNAP